MMDWTSFGIGVAVGLVLSVPLLVAWLNLAMTGIFRRLGG